MDDLIGVQKAIDAIERIFDRCEEIESHFPDGDPDKTGYKMLPDYMTVWEYLHQLSSADRHGRWEHYEHREPQYDIEGVKTWAEAYKCSNCGFIHSVIEDFGHYAYCPNCGARMDLDEVTE